MGREELIEKMCEAYDYPDGPADYSVCRSDGGKRHRHEMAAALDVAVGELLIEADDAEINAIKDHRGWTDLLFSRLLSERRSRYFKPKSDPAVEAVSKFIAHWDNPKEYAAKIVAAVRNADKGER